MKTTSLAVAVLMCLTIATAWAQTETPRATTRQKAQHARIHQGVQEGEITKGEARLLRKQQRHIRRTKQAAKTDGVVTPQEKAVIERKQDRASRNIKRARHNALDND
jgi:hypothetical protein